MTSPARDERRWTIYDCPECGIWVREEETEFHPAAESVEVMPVSEHLAALAAARQVDEAMVDRFIDAWRFDLNRQSSGLRPCVESALLAALTPEPEEKR